MTLKYEKKISCNLCGCPVCKEERPITIFACTTDTPKDQEFLYRQYEVDRFDICHKCSEKPIRELRMAILRMAEIKLETKKKASLHPVRAGD